MTITELKMLSDRLAILVADPQPGLGSWREALDKVLTELNEKYAGTDEKNPKAGS